MYQLKQKSLKEYTLIASTIVVNYQLGKYEDYNQTTAVLDGIVEAGGKVDIIIPYDGVFVLDIFNEPQNINDQYTIHNISSLLDRRNQFLTKSLTEYSPNTCTTRHLYDYVTFNLTFDTYIKLVESAFGDGYTDTIFPSTLYRINYLFEMLKKY